MTQIRNCNFLLMLILFIRIKRNRSHTKDTKPGFHAVCNIGTRPQLVQIETWFFGIIHCMLEVVPPFSIFFNQCKLLKNISTFYSHIMSERNLVCQKVKSPESPRNIRKVSVSCMEKYNMSTSCCCQSYTKFVCRISLTPDLSVG